MVTLLRCPVIECEKLALAGGVWYTVFMKATKVTLVMQAVGMYAMHLPLYILFTMELMQAENEALLKGLLIATLVLMALVFPVCVANIIISVASVFKGNTDVSKTVMKVKLALIPWYLLNFAMGFVLVAGMLNPFLMIGIPVVIGIMAVATYFCMLSTSLPNLAYYLNKVSVKKEEDVTSARIIAVVFHFIFCLDVIGSILFYHQNKKAVPAPRRVDRMYKNY